MPSGHVTNHSSPAPWVHEAPRLLDGTHLVLLILGHDAHTGTKGGGGQTYWLGPELGVSPAPSLGSPVVVLCARHEAQSRHGLPGHGQARGPLLQEAVPREGVAGESLLVFHHHHHHHHHHHCHLVCPEGAVVLQAAPRLAGPGGPRVDAGLLVPVEDEVIPGEVGVDVGALGQRQPVPGVDTWGSVLQEVGSEFSHVAPAGPQLLAPPLPPLEPGPPRLRGVRGRGRGAARGRGRPRGPAQCACRAWVITFLLFQNPR